MSVFDALLRFGAVRPERASNPSSARNGTADDEREGGDPKRLLLLIGLGGLSWVATYVGMLELIEANMGDLPFVHRIIIGCSVAMLMVMVIWLLDKMFSPIDGFTRACYIAGYVFLSIISVGFGFGFYWKVLESRGEASRSAESAITQVQSALFGASTRLEQLQSTLDGLTTVSTEKAEIERATGKSCPNSGPGDGPRRKMRDDDAQRFKFASDFVKGRIGTVKADMAALDADLQKIVKDDRSVIDPRTGNRNEFLRGVGRKLDLTVTGFNAFRTDPQLRQIRSDLAERAEKTTIAGAKGVTISCPDPQLQMALRGVTRAIDQLPEMEKPKIAAVEGSEATIEAFRRLTTTFFGLLSFKLPPSADELRELQKRAVQSVEGSGSSGAAAAVRAYNEQAAGLAKRDYMPLAVAIFVDLCLLLVSIGRPINRFVGLQRSMREAESGPVYPILERFRDIHADEDVVQYFEVFRDVIFDVNGRYHVGVPLYIPKASPHYHELKREAQTLANLCYALEGAGILTRPSSFIPALVVQRQLKRRGSKFVDCFGKQRTPHLQRARRALRGLVHETDHVERPAFNVYRFKKGAWPEMILQGVMGAARHSEPRRRRTPADDYSGPGGRAEAEMHEPPPPMPSSNGYYHAPKRDDARAQEAAFGPYARHMGAGSPQVDAATEPAPIDGEKVHAQTGANGHSGANGPSALVITEDVRRQPTEGDRHGAQSLAGARSSLLDALVRMIPSRRPSDDAPEPPRTGPRDDIEIDKISGRFGRSRSNG